jgi:hypothetical protein
VSPTPPPVFNVSELRTIDLVCSTEPCDAGEYRMPCLPGVGAICTPCSNTIPANAVYNGPGRPFNSDNCPWQCAAGYGVISGMQCTKLDLKDVPAVYITFGLDVTLEEFAAVEGEFIEVLAAALGIDTGFLTVTQVYEDKGQLVAEVGFILDDRTVEDICATLTPDAINAGLTGYKATILTCLEGSAPGAPPEEKTSLATFFADEENTRTVAIVGGALGGTAAVGGVATMLYNRPRLPKVFPTMPGAASSAPPANPNARQVWSDPASNVQARANGGSNPFSPRRLPGPDDVERT